MDNKKVSIIGKFNSGVECQRSIINIKNSSGPSLDPCRTPQITFLYSVFFSNLVSNICDSNGIQAQNHLVRKRKLNHLSKPLSVNSL